MKIFGLIFGVLIFVPGVKAETIKVDGSSTVFPITEAVSEEFQKLQKGKVNVTVGISGTGGGFKKFCRGETDIQDASRPISKEEMEACSKAGIKYFELPVAYDAITLVVSTKNTWLKEITVADLKKIWEPSAQGSVLKWKQVRATWPDEAFKLFGAGSDSGTFDYFTEAVVGKAKSSRGDYTASEDDNTLVVGVSNDKNALGYVPFSYYDTNRSKLRALTVVADEKSKGVVPTIETIKNGTYKPLARPIFIYVSEKSFARGEVKEFAEFYLKNAISLVPQVKYVPLPPKAYDIGADHLKKLRLGTAFGGESAIGIKIEDVLKKEAKF